MRSRPVIRMALLAIALSAASASAAPLHWGPRLGINASAFLYDLGGTGTPRPARLRRAGAQGNHEAWR